MKRPNILLIMTDNQPADALGCYGNPELQTPHLDFLASNGKRFDRAFCVNAMCSPCRASVLTGLMPSQHGVHNWLDDRLSDRWPAGWSAIEEFPNLPVLLKDSGYDTALIGKYHLGATNEPAPGFDHWVTFPVGHTTSFYGNTVIDGDARYRCEGHTVDFFTEKTLQYLGERRGARNPFFAFIPFNGPYGHWPAISGPGPEPFSQTYTDADMHSIPREGLNPTVLDRFAQRVGSGGVREQFKGPLILPNNLDALRNYFAQISLIDHSVGRILARLEDLEMAEDTIVIFTADHGFSLGHNGIWGHGAASFPASAHRVSYHIPLIMAGPGIESGVGSKLVSQIDLFPTILNMAGIETPDDVSDARSLEIGREAVFYEQEETRAIRTDDWLYVARFGNAPHFPMEDELYHLPSDPDEHVSLIHDPGHRGTAESLRRRIEAHFAIQADPQFDLWKGGSAKSNVTFDPLWQDAWGDEWCPVEPQSL